MRAIHFSPHTIEVSHQFAEREGTILLAALSAVVLVALIFAALGWYFWNFS